MIVSKNRRKNPFFNKTVQKDLAERIREAVIIAALPPQKRQAKATPGWTLKRFVQWLRKKWNIDCCRETVRKTGKKRGFSGKKAKKLLNKASKAQREDFILKITKLLDDALHQRQLLIYIDEAHIHLDTDEGYGWSIKGERFWISSSSPGRKKAKQRGGQIPWHKATASRQSLSMVSISTTKELPEFSLFQAQINLEPLTISDRLWVKKHLEPEEEKLRFSK